MASSHDRHSDTPPVQAYCNGTLYRLVDVGVHSLREAETFDPSAERRSCLTLIAIAGGCGEISLPGRRIKLRAGCVVQLPMYFTAPIRAMQAPAPLLVYRIALQTYRLAEQTAETLLYHTRLYSDPSEEAVVCESAELVALLQELARLYRDDSTAHIETLEELLRDAVRQLQQPDRLGNTTPDTPAGKIAYARKYIKENYGGRIARDELAAKLGLNADYFSSLFHKETGCRFTDYVTQVRIGQAQHMLLTARRRGLDEIAQSVGYADGLYLSRKFKQTVGVSPSAYLTKPKRIVALEYVGQLLALGIKPVGTVQRYLQKWMLFRNELAGVVNVGRFPEPDAVKALQPDVIVAHGSLSESVIERMREIAPTVVLPFNAMYPFEQLELFAEMFNRKEQARLFMQQYERKAAELRQRLEQAGVAGGTAIQLEIWNERLWIVEESDGRGAYNLYQSLGLRLPDRCRTGPLANQAAAGLLPEQLADYDADYVFVSVHEDDEPGLRAAQLAWAERLFKSALWNELPAVRSNRAYVLDFRLFPPCGDVFSLYRQLDIQERLLSGSTGSTDPIQQ